MWSHLACVRWYNYKLKPERIKRTLVESLLSAMYAHICTHCVYFHQSVWFICNSVCVCACACFWLYGWAHMLGVRDAFRYSCTSLAFAFVFAFAGRIRLRCVCSCVVASTYMCAFCVYVKREYIREPATHRAEASATTANSQPASRATSQPSNQRAGWAHQASSRLTHNVA